MPPRRRSRSRYLPARRSSGGASKTKLLKTEASLSRLRKKVRESKVPTAVKGAAAVLAGAAAAGAITGYGYDQIMGIDTDIALGVAAIAAGVSMGKPTPILFGAGVLTKSVGEWTESKVVELQAAA